MISKPLKIEILDTILETVSASFTPRIGGGGMKEAVASEEIRQAETIEKSKPKMSSNPEPGSEYVSKVGLTDVLIVDDSRTNNKILSLLFARKGLRSDVAENGKVAVDLVLEDIDRYKLIVMDNLMPVMNGQDATAIIRQAGFKYYIIALTGNVFEDDVRDFLKAGADMILFKPLDVEMIDRILLTIETRGPFSSPDRMLVESQGNQMLNYAAKPL